jgi:hypothetical protein
VPRLIISARQDQGDGTVLVLAVTPAGESISVVIGRDKINTDVELATLAAAARGVDDRAAALDARKGRTDWGET